MSSNRQTSSAGNPQYGDEAEDGDFASSALVERSSELTELHRLLHSPDVRIVTVTGTVGVGKSRVAERVFRSAAKEFQDGGRIVDLGEPVFRPGREQDLPELLADALGLDAGPGDEGTAGEAPRDRLFEGLREREFLLLLDGCDGIREQLAPLVAALVKDCPGLTVLVTGPERLGVYGEVLLRLEPLGLPSSERSEDLETMQQVPAVRLFIQRTRMVRPNFALTNENLDAVAKLCFRTDGIPLAIEFAAARMKLLSPQRLLAELDKDLQSLSGTEFDTLSRHRGMRQAIEQSLSGLTADEKEFLTRLATFSREFDAAAAEGVSPVGSTATQQLLERLVDKNLLRTTECPDGDLVITMLGLTRQYLLSRLEEDGDATGIRADHARYVLSLTASAEEELRGPEQSRALAQYDHWSLDIDAALRHFTDSGDGESVIRTASALRLFWHARGKARDAIRWLRTGLEMAGGTDASTGPLGPAAAARAELVLAELLLCTGEPAAAEEWLKRSRSRYEELDDAAGVASCLRVSGQVAFHRGDVAEAERRFTECTNVPLPGDAGEHGEALRGLAECHRTSGELQQAKSAAEESLAIFQRTKDVHNLALTEIVRADIAFGIGDQDTAIELYQSSMLQIAELGHLLTCTVALEKFAVMLTRSRSRPTESWRRATKAFGTAAGLRASTGFTAPAARKMEIENVMANARVRLGDHEADELAALGARMEPDVAITAVLTPLECAGLTREWESPDHPLTPRELEVAQLVASGLTNREIARRLGIAEWTAVNHLRKIMRKLACSSRVQVASWMSKRAEDSVGSGTGGVLSGK